MRQQTDTAPSRRKIINKGLGSPGYDVHELQRRKQSHIVISVRGLGGKAHQTSIQIGQISYLTLHAAGPPGEQFGLGDRQLAPGPTLLTNL